MPGRGARGGRSGLLVWRQGYPGRWLRDWELLVSCGPKLARESKAGPGLAPAAPNPYTLPGIQCCTPGTLTADLALVSKMELVFFPLPGEGVPRVPRFFSRKKKKKFSSETVLAVFRKQELPKICGVCVVSFNYVCINMIWKGAYLWNQVMLFTLSQIVDGSLLGHRRIFFFF